MYIPGAVMLLRTPEGDIIHAHGVRELGGDDPMTVDDHILRRFEHQADDRTVILQFVQEGAIALVDPVSEYRPDVPGGDDVTIAELLNMRSRLFNYSETYELNAGLDEQPDRECARACKATFETSTGDKRGQTYERSMRLPAARCQHGSDHDVGVGPVRRMRRGTFPGHVHVCGHGG